MNEVMKTKVAEYNAEELLTKRESVGTLQPLCSRQQLETAPFLRGRATN